MKSSSAETHEHRIHGVQRETGKLKPSQMQNADTNIATSINAQHSRKVTLKHARYLQQDGDTNDNNAKMQESMSSNYAEAKEGRANKQCMRCTIAWEKPWSAQTRSLHVVEIKIVVHLARIVVQK